MSTRNPLPKVVFSTFVHTVQCTTMDTPILNEYDICSKPYVKRFSYENGHYKYIFNPNKYEKIENISLCHLNRIMETIFNELGIQNYRLSRVDISINSTLSYDELYKINKFVKELYAVRINESNAYYSNGDDFTHRSMKVTNRDYELEIYNKELESKGSSPYKTRIEFRLKRLRKGQDFKNVLSYVSSTIQALPDCLNALVEKKVDSLYKQYIKEKGAQYEGRIQSLTNFVTKYAYDIYVYDILKGLYTKCCTGQCKNWLYQYHKSGKTLTLFSRQDLIDYLVQIRMSNDAYIKSIAHTSPFSNLQSA